MNDDLILRAASAVLNQAETIHRMREQGAANAAVYGSRIRMKMPASYVASNPQADVMWTSSAIVTFKNCEFYENGWSYHFNHFYPTGFRE